MILKTSLHILAMHFHEIMFGGSICSKPTAKYFTVDGDMTINEKYWEICDIRQDGKYPCCILGDSNLNKHDTNSVIRIHMVGEQTEIKELVDELNRRESLLQNDYLNNKIDRLQKEIAELEKQRK